MGLFNTLLKKDCETNTEEAKRYRQLLHFVSFAKKIKHLTGGINCITVIYESPIKQHNEYVSSLYATFEFCDFNEIKFAREYAVGSDNAPVNMVKTYYKIISERAGLTREDWPYEIDELDFADMLRGTGSIATYFTLIPGHHEDVFSFKVNGGHDTRSATQVYKTITKLLKAHFPELQITKRHVKPELMIATIQI